MRDLKIHTNQLFTLIHSLNFTKLPTNENNKFDTAFKLENLRCSVFTHIATVRTKSCLM